MIISFCLQNPDCTLKILRHDFGTDMWNYWVNFLWNFLWNYWGCEISCEIIEAVKFPVKLLRLWNFWGFGLACASRLRMCTLRRSGRSTRTWASRCWRTPWKGIMCASLRTGRQVPASRSQWWADRQAAGMRPPFARRIHKQASSLNYATICSLA